MRILLKYHALFVIFEKDGKFWNCRLLQIIDGALWVNITIPLEITQCDTNTSICFQII